MTLGRSLLSPTGVAHAAFVPTGVMTVLIGPILPILSARWSMTDAQAGEFFTAQFLASTAGVVVSGLLVRRLGYKAVILAGLVVMAVGVGFLAFGPRLLGMAAVACYGVGLGLSIPTCNLLVAEENPHKRAAALSLLNFSWSVGAVACPFLLAPFQRAGRISLFFYGVAGALLLISVLLAGVRFPTAQRQTTANASEKERSVRQMLATTSALVLGSLFFVYVGTENAVGGWLASFAKRLSVGPGTMWVMTPSFFYGGLLAGRALAPLVLRKVPEVRMVRGCVALATVGLALLLASSSLTLVMLSATIVGLGMAAVYPITISLLSQSFGSSAKSLGSVMFTLAGFGASFMPWLVGFVSTETASLKNGLTLLLGACVLMLGLYFRNWPEVELQGTPCCAGGPSTGQS